jgi:hypothetical protein
MCGYESHGLQRLPAVPLLCWMCALENPVALVEKAVKIVEE